MCKIFASFETFDSFESIRGVAVSTFDCRAEDPWFDSSFTKSVLISSRRLHRAKAIHFESFIQRKATSTVRVGLYELSFHDQTKHIMTSVRP